MLNEIKKALFYKHGQFSKTALFLSCATIILLILWPLQSLLAGSTLLGWWVVPAFSPGAATAVLGSLGALYAVNHGWVNKEGTTGEQLEQVREEMNKVLEAIKGEEE